MGARRVTAFKLCGLLLFILAVGLKRNADLSVSASKGRALQEELGQTKLGMRGLESVALSAAPAAVHGPLAKSGHVDPRWWHANSTVWREREFGAWLAASSKDPTPGGLTSVPPVVFRQCDPYINHLYRIIYIRCPKVASSTLLIAFTRCATEKHGDWCLEPMDRSLPPGELEAIWRDYYVFAFTRSPFRRALSTYKFLARKIRAEPQCSGAISWAAFCADPTSLGRICRSRKTSHCCVLGANFMYHHTVEQARCLTTAEGGWAVDFLGRVEHLEEDLLLLVAAINARRPPGVRAVRLNPAVGVRNPGGNCTEEVGELGLKLKNGALVKYQAAVAPEQYCQASKYFSGDHAACLPRLRHYYAADVALLGLDISGGSLSLL